jgi:peptide/nickel transport system ATP-binding protein
VSEAQAPVTEAPPATALEVSDLDLVYKVRGIDRPVLRGVSVAVERGRSYGLVGESGCGKSTAALAIASLIIALNFVADGVREVYER